MALVYQTTFLVHTCTLSRYAASAATPHMGGGFIHVELDERMLGVGEMLLSEEPESSLAWHSCQVKPCEWVCGENLCEVKIACFCNKILSSSPLTYTLGFSCDEVRDNLTYCVHLKRGLELLLGFDSLPSLWRCVVYVCLCYILLLFVSGGWYSNCSDTRSLFTRQPSSIWKGIQEHTKNVLFEPCMYKHDHRDPSFNHNP
jgi:hypothetical protein